MSFWRETFKATQTMPVTRPPSSRISAAEKWTGIRSPDFVRMKPSPSPSSVGERVWSEEQNASVRHGAWTTWHENGDKASEGVYQFGARTGPWSYWRVVGDRAVLDEARSGRYEADRKVE